MRLNRILAKLEHWNETAIKNQAEVLANKAIKVWSFPFVQLEKRNLNNNEAIYSNSTEYLQGEISELFEVLRKQILNIDASVIEEPKKKYIAFKTTTNFVDIVPHKIAFSCFLIWGLKKLKILKAYVEM